MHGRLSFHHPSRQLSPRHRLQRSPNILTACRAAPAPRRHWRRVSCQASAGGLPASAHVQQHYAQPDDAHQLAPAAANGASSHADAQSSGLYAAQDTASAVTPSAPGGDQHVQLFYSTGWPHATLHFSLHGGAWQDVNLTQVHSSGGRWSVAEVLLDGSGPGSSSHHSSSSVGSNGSSGTSPGLMEFVLHDGGKDWDKPMAGGNYSICSPGTWALRDGSVSQPPGRPLMLVSDLDDTMVGDEAAAAAFKAFWEDSAVTRGSLLVYNTGRALHKFEELAAQQQHCLAQPDVLISSVGTKVYNWTSSGWAEDSEYAARLHSGWRLDTVRDAAYAALAAAGRDSMHFRPPDEQNDHKVTCGVAASAKQQVQQQIAEQLEAQGVSAHLIWSGKGDWRFLDIVSAQAGKLAALEFVRAKHGYAHAQTVACGDSGNDRDMLSGRNLAIVVGNAQPDLLEWVESLSAQDGAQARRLLTAKASMAAGILEGLEAFGFK